MPSNPTNGGQQDDSAAIERVAVRTFSNHSAAELAAASLEARGLQCWITTDDVGGMLPSLAAASGVKLLVLASDAAAAAILLDTEATASDFSPLPEADDRAQAVAPPAPPRKRISVGALLLGAILGVLLCLLYQWANNRGERKYRYDWNDDGRADELLVYLDGRCRQSFRDRNFDGAWDEWADFDDWGRNSAYREDNNFDGRADEFCTYSNGAVASEQWDTDFNGTPDVTYFLKYGVIQRADWKPNNSTIVTLRQDYTNGVLFQTSRDLDGDGQFDEIVRYDAFHNPVRTNSFKILSPASP